MPTYYSETLVAAVNKLLATPAKEQSIITSWKKILQLLFEANVMKQEKQLIASIEVPPTDEVEQLANADDTQESSRYWMAFRLSGS